MLKAARLGALLVLCLLAPLSARAQALHRLDVDVFNSGTVWPIWVAQDKGFFAANALDVHLIPTPGSLAQMEGLIDGKFDIAMTAIDNLIAYMEGEGEAKTEAVPNIVAVMGSDNGFLSLLTAPGIKNFADLRGTTLSVDAFTTGYAFVLEEMLKVRGLTSSDYTLVKAGGFQQRFEGVIAGSQAGTLSVPPFTLLAAAKGFNDLGTAIAVLGHYQGVIAAVRKDWAPSHRDDLVGYIRAYIAAVSWLYDPANKAEALDIFEKHLPGATAEIAAKSYDVFLDPQTGFDRSAAIDMAGVKTVIDIRQQYAVPHKVLADPSRYYDLSYYDAATKH
jgi:ABC-type nitrate/sulfonate/bicarbonate transport system substrate-binding protein